LSARSIYPPVGTSDDIWNYQKRTLTERFTAFERARGYTASPAIIIRERRVIGSNTKFVINSSKTGGVFVFNEDLAKTAAKSILVGWTITGSGNELDGDDNTYMTITTPAGPFYRTQAIKYDLGSVKPSVVLILVYYSSTSYITCYVSVSSDDVTYTDVLQTNTTTKTTFIIRASNVRYIRLDFSNSTTAGYNAYLYTFEVYDKVIGNERVFTSLVEDLLTVIAEGYYQILEVFQQ
jgi:hypothetical protein